MADDKMSSGLDGSYTLRVQLPVTVYLTLQAARLQTGRSISHIVQDCVETQLAGKVDAVRNAV